MRVTEFRTPPVLLQGAGSCALIPKELHRLNVKNILIVTDKNLLQLGYAAQLSRLVTEAGCGAHVFDAVNGESRDAHTHQGMIEYVEKKCDCVLALGGGCSVDCAKGIAILATNGEKIRDYVGVDRIEHALPPLISVITSGGTGAEFSKQAHFTDSRDGTIVTIVSARIVPDIVVADPILSLSLSPQLTATSGLVALGHALEGFLSKKQLPLCAPLALSAIEIIGRTLRDVWCNGDDLKLRSEIMLGTVQSGLSAHNSSLSLLHTMADTLGNFFSMPYALAYSVMLPHWIDFCHIAKPNEFAQIARALGEPTKGLNSVHVAENTVYSLKKLCRDLEIPPLSELVKDAFTFENEIERMTQHVNASGLATNNARFATPARIANLYKKAYASSA